MPAWTRSFRRSTPRPARGWACSSTTTTSRCCSSRPAAFPKALGSCPSRRHLGSTKHRSATPSGRSKVRSPSSAPKTTTTASAPDPVAARTRTPSAGRVASSPTIRRSRACRPCRRSFLGCRTPARTAKPSSVTPVRRCCHPAEAFRVPSKTKRPCAPPSRAPSPRSRYSRSDTSSTPCSGRCPSPSTDAVRRSPSPVPVSTCSAPA